jgi:alanyl-tRNA synthetase
MQTLPSQEIGTQFTKFFASHGYPLTAERSLVQSTIRTSFLFSVGFIDVENVVLQRSVVPERFALTQRCFRHFDLDRVSDGRHLSFFRMAGALEAGEWSCVQVLDRVTRFLVEHLCLPKERLRVTVLDDLPPELRPALRENIRDVWKLCGIPDSAVVTGDMSTNFWREGANSGQERTGICGPHTEVFYDRGVNLGCGREDCGPFCNCGRFLEIVNIVFILARELPDRRYHTLDHSLVECGFGVERTAMILQDVESVWDLDCIAPLSAWFAGGVQKLHSSARETAVELPQCVLIDRARSLIALLSDGALPGPRGRGYVVRKMFASLCNAALDLGIGSGTILSELLPLALQIHHQQHGSLQTRPGDEVLNECDQEIQRLRMLGEGKVRSQKYVVVK